MASAAEIRDAIANVIATWAADNLPRSISVGTQTMTFQSLSEANETYRFWAERATAAAAAAGTAAPLRQFGMRFRGPQ